MPYGLTYSLSLIFLCVVYQLHLYYIINKNCVNTYFIFFKKFFFSFIFLFFPLILIIIIKISITRRKHSFLNDTRRNSTPINKHFARRNLPPKNLFIAVLNRRHVPSGMLYSSTNKKRPIPSGLLFLFLFFIYANVFIFLLFLIERFIRLKYLRLLFGI